MIFSKKATANLSVLILVIICWGLGCASETRKEVIGPLKTDFVPPPPLSVKELDSKVRYLKKILQDKGLPEDDRQTASALLITYESIKSDLEARPELWDNRRVLRMLFEALSRLDEKYFSKERFDERSYPKVLDLFSSKRKKLIKDYFSGDYQGVINECHSLEDAFGAAALTPEIGLFYAMSLAKKGMFNEAVKIGERIARDLEGKPDLVHLQAQIIEWQLATGQKKQAEASFKKLSESVSETEALVKRARQRVGGEESKVALQESLPASGETPRESEIQGPRPIEKLLGEINDLVQRNEFTKAKFLLFQQRMRFSEGPEADAIDQAMRSVELAEEKSGGDGSIATKPPGENEGVKVARKLIEEENFEEAITKLDELKDDQSAVLETRELREKAIEKLINRERNKAAKLFLMAKNTSSPQKKEELLLSSYSILKFLIDKYPSSPLTSKINDNMNRIKEELNKLKKEPG